MRTNCFDLQDGMPAIFRNRNVSELDLQDGMPANFRNRQADWGGLSPVSTGMRTVCFDLQDGMPAIFRNRNVSEVANCGNIMLADFRHH